jgi:ABC-type uncharacterized transport system auxiliary subunit
MNRPPWRIWQVVAWSLLLSGCSLTKPGPEVHHYTLALTPPEVAAGSAKASLQVRPFSAPDPYLQDRLVYRLSPYQLDFYHSHRWASSPTEQVTDWTRRYLRGSGLFTSVSPTTEGAADFVLSGRVRQFDEVDHEQTWEAVLQVDFWLVRGTERSPIWFSSYTASQQASKRNPVALAEAMSRNLENILGRLAADLAPVVAGPLTP